MRIRPKVRGAWRVNAIACVAAWLMIVALLQTSYQYVKRRRQFGKHPDFKNSAIKARAVAPQPCVRHHLLLPSALME